MATGTKIDTLGDTDVRPYRDVCQIIDPCVFANPGVFTNLEAPWKFDSHSRLDDDAFSDHCAERAEEPLSMARSGYPAANKERR